MSLMWTGRWTWMRSLVLRSRSEQNRSLEKTVMANAEVTGGKAAETVEASETTEEVATVVDSDGTTVGRAVETTEAAETIEGAATVVDSDGTTVGRAVETIEGAATVVDSDCLLYTSPSPRDKTVSRMPSSA